MLSATLAATLALAPAALAQDIGKLQEALEGIDALWRSDSAFSDASTPFNQRYDYQPVGIVMPNSAEQISTAIKAANAQNIPVAARGGGHSYAALGLGGQDDTLVIDMSNIADTTVDAQSNQASIGGGARLGDVALALNDAGRAIPHGSCSYVGVGGHFAMGGYGFPSRQWGLSTDNVASVEAVLPNGTIADVSKDSYPDLFWGIQGAANAFAIVTKYNMKTFQAPSEATHYMYTWQLSADDAAKGMQSWQDFVNSDIPAEFGTQITYGKGSSKGQVTFSFTGAYYGSSDSFNATIEPFLDQMPDGPSRDVTQGSWIDIVTKLSNGQPLDTSSEENYHDTFYAKSLMIPALNDDAGSAWISYMANEGYDSETAWFVQQELYGGSNSKINEVAADATAFAHRSALATVQFYASSSSYAPPYPEDGFSFLDNMVSSITSKQDVGGDAYPNYIDDRLDDPLSAYYGENAERLSSLKTEVDPNNVFRSNAIILPASDSSSSSSSTASASDDSQEPSSSAIDDQSVDGDERQEDSGSSATSQILLCPWCVALLIIAWTISQSSRM